MKNLKQICLILLFSFLGELCRFFIPLTMPASIYGIVLLFAALALKIIRVEDVRQTGSFLTSMLPVLFVSPMVGIAERWGLIAPHLVPIALILLSTTALTFGIAGKITQWLIRRGGGTGA